MTVTLAEIDHPPTEPDVPEPKADRRRLWALIVVLATWVVLGIWLQGKATLDLPTAENTDFQQWLTTLRDNVEQAKFEGNPLFWPLDWVTEGLRAVVEALQRLFSTPEFPRPVPEIGWAGVVALTAWVAYAMAGVRMAVAASIGMLIVGYLGYWEESIDTLIVVGVAVFLCIIIGLPLGIWMSRSRRATTAITPVLDLLQTMPAIAYLAPLALLFGIGSSGAVVVTLMYALPPLVRISAHGLRTVSPTTVEATTALGSTSRQLLTKVQLPMSRRTIIVGLNQTIMAALSMATIAAFIDGPGLGKPIVRALGSLNVGVALVAGLCVVTLAIILDRTLSASGERSTATSRKGVDPRRHLAVLVGGGIAVIVAVYLSHTRLSWAQFPASDIGQRIAVRVNEWVTWITDNFRVVTSWINDTVTIWLLRPLTDLLANCPWWLVAVVILALAIILGGVGSLNGRRTVAPVALCAAAVLIAGLWASGNLNDATLLAWVGITLLLVAAVVLRAGGALLPTAICLVLIFGVGLWNDTMVTLAMVLVATLIVMVIGVVIGVWMGRSRRADTAIRPILDFLQTMPALVYLIPAVALFPPGAFLAMAAAVLYAAPAAIKITADGIRSVSPTTVEAAEAAGSSRWQMVSKVQLPMSKGSMLLAANQGLLFVLSMVVIGSLVGGGALGFLVVNGFSQGQAFGKGLAAGIAITALGVLLDRITVHTAARYGRAENA